MRYQHLLLPALAGSVVAQLVPLLEDWDAQTPGALPVEELRYVPVVTNHAVKGSPHQDVLSATTASNANEDSGSKLKRTPTSVDRQPHKRAACDPLPTLPNTYNVNMANEQSFRSDPAITSVANNANPAPTGYYQTYKNLQAASNPMKPLATIIVNTTKGYDVDFYASACNAQPNCLAFNIFFERDPTLTPGGNCPNPPAFANIKCTLWRTALDPQTATNRGGSATAQFTRAIAGSNAYNSYKLGGPIPGWTSSALNTAIMNAPLYDCARTWSYLGYKLFQPASVDPRLCAAACDAQTAYNKAHPAAAAGSPPVACNAFGSYILTKTNGTRGRRVSFEVGQMCTLYTQVWNETFAVNRAAFDDGVGAKYTYGFSTFWGKEGAQNDCGGK